MSDIAKPTTDWERRCEQLVADARRSDEQMRLLRATADAAIRERDDLKAQLDAAKGETRLHRNKAYGLAQQLDAAERKASVTRTNDP